MPFGIGPLELVLLLIVILVIFGPKRLPQAGRSLGQGMREFKDSVTGKDKDRDEEVTPELPATEQPPASEKQPAATTAATDDASRAFGRDE